MGFIPKDGQVEVKQITDTQWELLREFGYEGEKDRYSVPMSQTTDFASVPRVFAWFIPPYGRYTRPAILHDYLWRELAAQGKIRWVDADGMLRRSMREVDVPFLRRWMMWAAVRWAALFKPAGTKGWLKEMPRVLLVTAVGLPIVVPPAAVIVVALLVYHGVEWILWVPLKINAVIRDRRGRPAKEVVQPRLSFKL